MGKKKRDQPNEEHIWLSLDEKQVKYRSHFIHLTQPFDESIFQSSGFILTNLPSWVSLLCPDTSDFWEQNWQQ